MDRGGSRRGAHVQANAGFGEVNRDEADDQSDRGQHLEVDERLQAEAADGLCFRVAGDAGDERAEDQGCDDDPDQPQEDVAEEAAGQRGVRRIDAQLNAGQHADEDPAGKGAAARRSPRKQKQPEQQRAAFGNGTRGRRKSLRGARRGIKRQARRRRAAAHSVAGEAVRINIRRLAYSVTRVQPCRKILLGSVEAKWIILRSCCQRCVAWVPRLW